MTVAMILLPLFVLVLITFALLFWTGRVRVRAIRSGKVKTRDIALREPNWPPHVTQVGNAYLNQFELPLLFYVLTILTMVTRTADLIFVLLSWVFVATRAGACLHLRHQQSCRLPLPGLPGRLCGAADDVADVHDPHS